MRKTVEIIEVTSLVPKEWVNWFYGLISENAPFSWGDNNRTLVTASRFHTHVFGCLDLAIEDEDVSQEDVDSFLEMLEGLGETYIDLEN